MACRSVAIIVATIGLAGLPTPSPAQEACHGYGTQFGDFRICASSVLAPQGGNRYGPEPLNGTTDGGAWCEGAAGPGAGQSVTFHQRPANVVGKVTITNGYARTAQSFRDNGRVKHARIETNGGTRKEIVLKDQRAPQAISFSPSRVSWIRLTIIDVYPGARHQDTCISLFSPDIEEFGSDN
jgi:hypothetical protein